jgi:hypothetical protein
MTEISSSSGSICRALNLSAPFSETPKRPLSDFRLGILRPDMRAAISLLSGLKSSPCLNESEVEAVDGPAWTSTDG